jgi:Txe/YoeB family toxin of Txe-Axe toxin-antitoxin module
LNQKPVLVVFSESKLQHQFELLQIGTFQDKELYQGIQRTIDEMKDDPACGIKIPKKLWPKTYQREYNITNLWKYNLTHGWRLIYTIKQDEIRIINIILEWFDHKAYEKRFKY